jgi:hypothetical protein
VFGVLRFLNITFTSFWQKWLLFGTPAYFETAKYSDNSGTNRCHAYDKQQCFSVMKNLWRQGL